MAELLKVEGLRSGYGEAVVVQGVSLALEQGQSLALLGRNGTGKTTLLNTLVGVTRRHAGRVCLAGREIHNLPVHERAAAGIGWVPQERNIFKSLTVLENLSAVARPGPWSAQRVFELFPRMAERKGNLGSQLSGGEQQMLAFGRALVHRQGVDLAAGQHDAASVAARHAHECVDEGGLASAVAAEQRE